MAGEFSVRNTSAGEAAPSWTIWLPNSVSLPLRKVTLMPVSRVNPSTHACGQAGVLGVVDDDALGVGGALRHRQRRADKHAAQRQCNCKRR